MVQHNFRKPEVEIARASDNHRQIVFFGFTFVLLVFDQGERRVLRVDPISDPPGHVLISCSRRANLSSTAGLASGRITPYPMTPKRMYPSEIASTGAIPGAYAPHSENRAM